jgi:glycerol uptake facilitator-like aquaporin
MKIDKLLAELVGTATLLISVVGSSFMAAQLTSDRAVALLVNAAVTASTLAILIKVFASISGAHFNPAVSLAALMTKRIELTAFFGYVIAQLIGAVFGVLLANAMFSNSILTLSNIERSGTGQIVGESIATLGLLFLALSADAKSAWKLIPLWIFGAYFFTVSTSFANPAVTLSRSLTDAPSGIAISSVSLFVLVQLLAAAVVAVVFSRKARHE